MLFYYNYRTELIELIIIYTDTGSTIIKWNMLTVLSCNVIIKWVKEWRKYGLGKIANSFSKTKWCIIYWTMPRNCYACFIVPELLFYTKLTNLNSIYIYLLDIFLQLSLTEFNIIYPIHIYRHHWSYSLPIWLTIVEYFYSMTVYHFH